MAATKTGDRGVQYHVADPYNNHLVASQAPPSAGASVMRFTQGGNVIDLSKQNVTDLLTMFTAFSATGVVS